MNIVSEQEQIKSENIYFLESMDFFSIHCWFIL